MSPNRTFGARLSPSGTAVRTSSLRGSLTITGRNLYPRTEAGESTGNHALGAYAPASGSDGTVAFSTTTTTRYILLKPGASGTTSPNQTTSPVGIAAQAFGYDALLAELTDSLTGYGRSIPPGVWTFNQQIALSAGDVTNTVYGVVANVYRRSTTGTYTLLFGVAATDQAGGVGATTLTFAWSSTSQPSYDFANGETLHVEYWIHGKGIAVTGQTITFDIGSADSVVLPSPGIFTLDDPYGSHQVVVNQAPNRAASF